MRLIQSTDDADASRYWSWATSTKRLVQTISRLDMQLAMPD